MTEFESMYGSRQFEWRITSAEMASVSFVIALRKFEPWRDELNINVLRIVEGRLLWPSNAYNLLSENKNPHR